MNIVQFNLLFPIVSVPGKQTLDESISLFLEDILWAPVVNL